MSVSTLVMMVITLIYPLAVWLGQGQIADGQHRVSDIPRFLEQAAAHPQALIVGCSEYGATVPLLRFYGRY